MLSQTIPTTQDSFECEHGLINFVTGRNDVQDMNEEDEYCYDNNVDIEMETKNNPSL